MVRFAQLLLNTWDIESYYCVRLGKYSQATTGVTKPNSMKTFCFVPTIDLQISIRY